MKHFFERRMPLQFPEAQTAVQATEPCPSQTDANALDEFAVPDIRLKPTKTSRMPWLFAAIPVGGVIVILGILVWREVMCQGFSMKDAARAQVCGPLSQACKVYHRNNGEFPGQLRALIERDKAGIVYIDHPAALLDPWGNPYQYNPKGPNNRGDMPDIWTVAPDGTVIGNWSTLNQGRPAR